MATEVGYTLGKRALQQVSQMIRRYAHDMRNETPDGSYQLRTERIVTGATIGTITAATSALTGATTFTFALLRRTAAGDLEDTTLRLTGTNRDMTLTALDGTLLYLARIDGEWRPTWVGCEPDPDLEALT